METQPYNWVSLRPGSRPWSRFYDDPSVTCLHNPSQYKCQQSDINWHQEQHYYQKTPVYQSLWLHSNISRLSCADFYDQTDGLPLWWQNLRQDALWGITETDITDITVLLSDGAPACVTNASVIEFHIHWQSGMEKHYVAWNRRRQSQIHPNDIKSIGVCYHLSSAGPDQSVYDYNFISMVHAVFTDCLWHYGEITRRSANPPTYTESGT